MIPRQWRKITIYLQYMLMKMYEPNIIFCIYQNETMKILLRKIVFCQTVLFL